jgi:hypothetical protein
MRIAGIDPSITSTAVCLSEGDTDRFIIYGKPRKGKWWDAVKHVCELKVREYEYPDVYSEQEIYKVRAYTRTAESIADDVAAFRPDIVCMEGFSYSSQAGDLIDLVTFGSALRMALLNCGLTVQILAPTELKSASCALAYGRDTKGIPRRPIREGEKNGLAGGKFTKREMLEAAVFHDESCDLLSCVGRDMVAEALSLAAVPKPLDDMVDALWLSRMGRMIYS